MGFIELLIECQGDDSQQAFARRIDCSQSSLSRILSGRRRPGLKVLAGFLRAYPGLRKRALALFFAFDYADCTEHSLNRHDGACDHEPRSADGQD